MSSLLPKDVADSYHEIPESEQHETAAPTQSRISQVSKTISGFVIVIGIAVSWVGSTQFATSTYSKDFFAPSFNVWFSTVWIIVCYPVFIVGALIVNPKSRSRDGILNLHR